MLKAVSITYAICHQKAAESPSDHLEIWVDEADVERARDVIQVANVRDNSLKR